MWKCLTPANIITQEENAITFTLSPGQKAGQPLSLQFAIADDQDTVVAHSLHQYYTVRDLTFDDFLCCYRSRCGMQALPSLRAPQAT